MDMFPSKLERLVEKIKSSPGYTKQIGLQLGIELPDDEGDAMSPPEFPASPFPESEPPRLEQ